MRKLIQVRRSVLILCLVHTSWGAAYGQATQPAPPTLTDAQIRDLLVQRSIASYSIPCPCPESLNSRGDPCGANSAYARRGSNRPLCYPSNVTDAMVRRFREALAQ